ncbi:MAG TPA: crossover junction endodeoxyribonuclease RuvC [Actinomycetota bacterium]|nr:crossover junction endodeoxyribonuclease RuvC [Actinomycetota bacterium]
MRVIGIDPGYATTGYGVVERRASGLRVLALGALRTPAELTAAERLADLRRQLMGLLDVYRPEVLAIERVFFNANVRTAMRVGQAAGVVLATAAENGLDVADYTPSAVKQAVAGVGNAPKPQVQKMVAALLGLAETPRPPDAADACALAICHLSRRGLDGALRRALT